MWCHRFMGRSNNNGSQEHMLKAWGKSLFSEQILWLFPLVIQVSCNFNYTMVGFYTSCGHEICWCLPSLATQSSLLRKMGALRPKWVVVVHLGMWGREFLSCSFWTIWKRKRQIWREHWYDYWAQSCGFWNFPWKNIKSFCKSTPPLSYLKTNNFSLLIISTQLCD